LLSFFRQTLTYLTIGRDKELARPLPDFSQPRSGDAVDDDVITDDEEDSGLGKFQVKKIEEKSNNGPRAIICSTVSVNDTEL
jgi:hypothetical protein